MDTVQALYYWHRALTAARTATHGGGSTLASVRRARVYPGWYSPSTAFMKEPESSFQFYTFCKCSAFEEADILSPFMALYIGACGDNLISRTEGTNSHQPVHLLTVLDLHMKLLDFSVQKN